MAQQSMKTLTIGPPKGQISTLISKVSAINAKHGPFDALFVVGDFFSSAENLNQEEADLLDSPSKYQLPIRTYIHQSKNHPPPRVRNHIDSLTKGKRKQEEKDCRPIQIADNLYWLGKDQVNWIPKDGPIEEEVLSGGDVIVDEDSQNAGLRVAVCGGIWDPNQWAQEVQGIQDPGQNTQQEKEADFWSLSSSTYILPSSLERLYRHPAFKPPPQAAESSSKSNSNGEPQSLAAARAQMKAEQDALSSQSSSSKPSYPAIDIVLLPAWPSGISLFAKSFPPNGAPEEARTWGLPPLAEVMRRARPRYGFAIAPEKESQQNAQNTQKPEWAETGVFWEREPYLTSQAGQQAPVGSRGSGSGSNATPVSGSRDKRLTRFISLAQFSNAKKVRWFMALNMKVGPSSGDVQAADVKGATQSPFGVDFHLTTSKPVNGDVKRKAEGGEGLASDVNFRWQQGNKKVRRDAGERDDGPPPEGYICKICGSRDHYIRLCPHKSQPPSSARGGSAATNTGLPNRPQGAEQALGPRVRREPIKMVGPEDCWFCLSNSGCAKHLIVAIGQESYLALPKGQLPPASSEASPVPGGGHVLIVPITHTSSVESMTDEESKLKLSTEMQEYMEALRKCYEAYGCILVAWYIVKTGNTRAGHLQIQVVPVPESRILKVAGGIESNTFENALHQSALTRGYDLEEIHKKKKLGDPIRREYFEIQIHHSSNDQKIYQIDLSEIRRFDYQFARNTLANYLGANERADWRQCVTSEKVEEVETKTFRNAFMEFMPDFGQDDDDDDDDDDE
ncbi:unnamed protein product [Sympodiomycopsis kandeliae]